MPQYLGSINPTTQKQQIEAQYKQDNMNAYTQGVQLGATAVQNQLQRAQQQKQFDAEMEYTQKRAQIGDFLGIINQNLMDKYGGSFEYMSRDPAGEALLRDYSNLIGMDQGSIDSLKTGQISANGWQSAHNNFLSNQGYTFSPEEIQESLDKSRIPVTNMKQGNFVESGDGQGKGFGLGGQVQPTNPEETVTPTLPSDPGPGLYIPPNQTGNSLSMTPTLEQPTAPPVRQDPTDIIVPGTPASQVNDIVDGINIEPSPAVEENKKREQVYSVMKDLVSSDLDTLINEYGLGVIQDFENLDHLRSAITNNERYLSYDRAIQQGSDKGIRLQDSIDELDQMIRNAVKNPEYQINLKREREEENTKLYYHNLDMDRYREEIGKYQDQLQKIGALEGYLQNPEYKSVFQAFGDDVTKDTIEDYSPENFSMPIKPQENPPETLIKGETIQGTKDTTKRVEEGNIGLLTDADNFFKKLQNISSGENDPNLKAIVLDLDKIDTYKKDMDDAQVSFARAEEDLDKGETTPEWVAAKKREYNEAKNKYEYRKELLDLKDSIEGTSYLQGFLETDYTVEAFDRYIDEFNQKATNMFNEENAESRQYVKDSQAAMESGAITGGADTTVLEPEILETIKQVDPESPEFQMVMDETVPKIQDTMDKAGITDIPEEAVKDYSETMAKFTSGSTPVGSAEYNSDIMSMNSFIEDFYAPANQTMRGEIDVTKLPSDETLRAGFVSAMDDYNNGGTYLQTMLPGIPPKEILSTMTPEDLIRIQTSLADLAKAEYDQDKANADAQNAWLTLERDREEAKEWYDNMSYRDRKNQLELENLGQDQQSKYYSAMSSYASYLNNSANAARTNQETAFKGIDLGLDFANNTLDSIINSYDSYGDYLTALKAEEGEGPISSAISTRNDFLQLGFSSLGLETYENPVMGEVWNDNMKWLPKGIPDVLRFFGGDVTTEVPIYNTISLRPDATTYVEEYKEYGDSDVANSVADRVNNNNGLTQ